MQINHGQKQHITGRLGLAQQYGPDDVRRFFDDHVPGKILATNEYTEILTIKPTNQIRLASRRKDG